MELAGQGTFEVELYYKHAPRTCRNFQELARRGYYDGTIFHRVIEVRQSTLSCENAPMQARGHVSV